MDDIQANVSAADDHTVIGMKGQILNAFLQELATKEGGNAIASRLWGVILPNGDASDADLAQAIFNEIQA